MSIITEDSCEASSTVLAAHGEQDSVSRVGPSNSKATRPLALSSMLPSGEVTTEDINNATPGELLRFTVPGGIFNPDVLATFNAICIPNDCTGVVASSALSMELAEQFKHACPFQKRVSTRAAGMASPSTCDTPGTVSFVPSSASPAGTPAVFNMHLQFYAGRPRSRKSAVTSQSDTSKDRSDWFRSCLDALGSHRSLPSRIAIPWLVGCTKDEAGDWASNLAALRDFAAKNPQTRIAVVQSTSDSLSKALATMAPFYEASREAIALALDEPDEALCVLYSALAAELQAQGSHANTDALSPKASS